MPKVLHTDNMTPLQTAEYIRDRAVELSLMGMKHNHPMLSYYMDLAAAEADDFVRNLANEDDK